MTGIGAWPHLIQPFEDDRSDPNGRDANRLMAMKRELIYNGYADGINPTLPYYGDAAQNRCKEFQKANGLVVDAIIGPNTARSLFRKRFQAQENRFGVPDPWLRQMGTVESSDDPVAQGYVDPNDEGLMQIHLSFFPDITIYEAWDPAFCIPWGAGKVASNITYCNGDVQGGVAAYNVGRFYALQWVKAGKPQSGGQVINGQDIFAVAYNYVNLVHNTKL